MSWAALGSVVLWGISAVAIKMAMEELLPSTLLALQFGVGAVLLASIELRRDRRFLKAFSLRDWACLALLAAAGVLVHPLLQSYVLLFATAVDAAWVLSVQPVLIMLGGRLFLGEAITARKITGVVLGFLGVSLVISKGLFPASIGPFASLRGVLFVLISAITWVVFTVGGRRFGGRFTPLASMTPILGMGFFFFFLVSTLQRGWSGLSQVPAGTWVAVLFIGIFGSGLGYLFWFMALGKKDSGTVGMTLYLEPLAIVAGAYFLLGEPVEGMTLAGGLLTLLGVYFSQRA